MIGLALALALELGIPEPRPPASQAPSSHPDAIAFFADRNAQVDVNRAFSDAKLTRRNVVIVMGANWCHDSRALASWLDTPRFLPLMIERYHIVYVDVGTPQTGQGRNLDIAARFGIAKVKATPLVIVVSPDGNMLNSRKDARSWRNAASRSEDAIFGYFKNFVPVKK